MAKDPTKRTNKKREIDTNSDKEVSDYWGDVMDILSSEIEIPSLGGESSGKVHPLSLGMRRKSTV